MSTLFLKKLFVLDKEPSLCYYIGRIELGVNAYERKITIF